ncbi:hypothetical protein LWC34_47060 [Kibdelosporangium philippinense]|uniref:Alpha/beta hydrolase n=1 Tax=Kibdelosporangium philippinense TaxID=211113 RepID=A0ABS8ZTK3_9PSEU|nr:hypothetical protein [Kibdelosporangium philippinense]MCE7010315.1 hypothetical protein [Kibdelosporangium philippinense]
MTVFATVPAANAAPPSPRVPQLQWTDCGDGFQCASAEVPFDYRRPNGRTINLGMTRKLAPDPTRRIGSLFFSPGGPGAGLD